MRRVAAMLLLAAAGVFFISAVRILPEVSGANSDVPLFYTAAKLVAAHPASANIYDQPTLAHLLASEAGCGQPQVQRAGDIVDVFPRPYVYPPLFVLFVEPLTTLSCPAVFRAWVVAGLCLWLLAAFLSALLVYRATGSLFTVSIALALVLCSPLFAFEVWGGNITLGILDLLLLAFLLLPRHPRLAGAVFALAACLKVYPALFLAGALIRRDWAVLRGALPVVLVATLVMAIGAPASLLRMPTALPQSGIRDLLTPSNVALARVSTPLGIGLVAVVLCGWLLTLTLVRDLPRLELAQWTLLTMLLVSPVLFRDYLIWLLPVLLLRAPRAVLLLGGATYLAASFAFRWSAFYIPALPLLLLACWVLLGAPRLAMVAQGVRLRLRASVSRWLPSASTSRSTS